MSFKYMSYFFVRVFFTLLTGLFATLHSYPNNEIDAFLKANQFQGVAFVAQKGKILLNRGYGFANAEHQISNSPQTVFRIGSITKLFTAVAILQLQEKGLLNVKDPIVKYIPDYPHGDKILIHYLLSHMSGIPSIYHFPNLLEIQRQPATLSQAMAHFKDLPLQFIPGHDCASSDSGYIILGAIIENVTGQSYEAYLDKNIFRPLNLTATFYDYNHYVIPHRASGYQYKEGKLLHAPFIDMSLPHAAGALSSTAEDLYKFDQALKGTALLSKVSLDALFTVHASNAENKIASGYGFRIGPLNRGMEECESSIVGHFATIDGFEGAFIRYQNEDLTIILLSNLQKTDVRTFHKKIAAIFLSPWRFGASALRSNLYQSSIKFIYFLKNQKGEFPCLHLFIQNQTVNIYLAKKLKRYLVKIKVN
ncbi:MAG: beta-lactamase family protein [Candidatus Protochlamydia sp.]|nr:beta-lactamase family protein [Candidatus Protochlamydia sp.]